MRLISAGSLVRAQSGPFPKVEAPQCRGDPEHLRSAISQNRHTIATESSRQWFHRLPWTLTLCILHFFQSLWFLKKFAPREKCSWRSEERRVGKECRSRCERSQ